MSYSQCYERQMLHYFEDGTGAFPTFAEFARSVGVTVAELHRWRKEQPSFAAAWEECRERQKSHLIRGALTKQYDPSTCKYLLSELFGLGEESRDESFSVTVEVVE
ncbi:MAG: hypothetical protein IJC29_04570 [Clostridia bacterium]|nr:hypothetical protein [Clostridia bacterium]